MQVLNHLPPHQIETVRAVTREIRELDQNASSILASFDGSFDPSTDPAAACALLVDHLCMRRNKRCLLAYHRVRVEKLEGMCWKGEEIIDIEQSSTAIDGTNEIPAPENDSKNSLSPEEEEYLKQFNDLLAAYRGRWTDINLGGSLEPPQELFIDVRVLKDAGEIQTEYGYDKLHSICLC